MPDTPGSKVEPYRLEWRADYTTGWVLIARLDKHPGALKPYVKSQSGWGWTGQWRLISQHVIEVTGIVS